jgi:hypothetical protein
MTLPPYVFDADAGRKRAAIDAERAESVSNGAAESASAAT